MEENLITKKELLEITGISYGALYRWKRMKLLPDEWFTIAPPLPAMRRSSPGIRCWSGWQRFSWLKESMSLDEIARLFQPGPPAEVSLTAQDAAAARHCGSAGDQSIPGAVRRRWGVSL